MEEQHTDIENERLREMFHYILDKDWNITQLTEIKKAEKYDWCVSTIIRIFEKGEHTTEVGNFLVEQETRIIEEAGDKVKCHDIAKKLSYAYHKLNTQENY